MGQFTTIITELINSKREGEYWDFKREPHDNNASLLHDIICLSNALYIGDRYIVIGVSDPSNNCQIIGLAEGQTNRKNQSNMIDFLRRKPFAGDIRPEIELHTLVIEGKNIDVIIIKDNPFKPYYLTSDFNDNGRYVKAHNIYTRIGDTNTSISGSADLYHIEKMWRQRFGLDLSPSERFKHLLLKPQEWTEDFGNTNYAYHKDFPEFRIELSSPERMEESYCEFYPNNKGYHGIAYFLYQSNKLFELVYVYCDEMRILLSEPEIKHVKINKESYWYYYYDLSNRNGLFLRFLLGRRESLSSRGLSAPFLIFKDKSEINKFHHYVENNQAIVLATNPMGVPNPRSYNSVISLEFLCKAKMIYDQNLWRE